MSTGHLVLGDPQHGVTRFAEDLLAHLPGPVPVARARTVDELLAQPDWTAPLAGCDRVHLQYTDGLYGRTGEEAAAALVGLVEQVRVRRGAECWVTLHDLPQPADGERLLRRRAAAYREVVAAAAAVVVSSAHESALLDALEPPDRPRFVVPLPIDPPAGPVHPVPGDGQVTVLGFVHPGKGHADALDAMAALPTSAGMVALGRTAPGHDHLVDELTAQARSSGRGLTVTGFVDDAELPARLRTAGVPLAPHRGVSASASIGTWLTAGRRPLVPEGRYAAELEQRCPGALWIYPRAGLADALALALTEPHRTWTGPGVRVGPSRPEVSAAYARLRAGA